MAPEQLEGKECDPRTDIYALGLVLYEMATRKRPPKDQPLPVDGFPDKFAHMVERCLQKDPENRWQTAQGVKAELEWAAKSVRPTSLNTAAPRTHWWIAAVATLLLAILVG